MNTSIQSLCCCTYVGHVGDVHFFCSAFRCSSERPTKRLELLIEAMELLTARETFRSVFENPLLPFMSLSLTRNCVEWFFGFLVTALTNELHPPLSGLFRQPGNQRALVDPKRGVSVGRFFFQPCPGLSRSSSGSSFDLMDLIFALMCTESCEALFRQ